MKKFMLFVSMAVFFIIGNLGLSYGDVIKLGLDINSLDPQFLLREPFGPIENQLYEFEFTNNTGQMWTDFHLQVAFFSPTTETGLAWFNDYYEGPGSAKFSRFNASLPLGTFDVVDIVGLNIPFLTNIPNKHNTYKFQLNISSGEGWELTGNPTVDGVPEPGTLLLLGSGLIGLLGLGRKKFLQN